MPNPDLPPQDALPSPDRPSPEKNAVSISLLNAAWERQRVYSKNASSTQERFFALERIITLMSILVVVLAVAHPIVLQQVEAVTGQDSLAARMPFDLLFNRDRDQQHLYVPLGILNLLLIIIPITMTGLRAFAIKFGQGNSWVLLRGNAEALKMEIFYYRTQVQKYKVNRNAELAAKIQAVSQRLKGSVVQQRALLPYENQPPTQVYLGILLRLGDRLSTWITQLVNRIWDILFGVKEKAASRPRDPDPNADLDPESYLKYRLEDQFDWYRRKARSYDRQHQFLQSGVYVFGGVGTLLAAIGGQGWVAVTTAMAAALANYLEYRRVEATLMGYNQAADTLYDIRTWWLSLPEVDKADFKNFEKLVVNTEETIRSENNSWLQDMQDRLANLYDADQQAPPPGIEDEPKDNDSSSVIIQVPDDKVLDNKDD